VTGNDIFSDFLKPINGDIRIGWVFVQITDCHLVSRNATGVGAVGAEMVRESPSGGAGYITTSSQWQLPLSFPERRKKLLDTC
jgi:hypothetical protein